MYCPARITKIASDMGLRPVWALDLTTIDPEDGMPWDFTKENKKRSEMKLLDIDQPVMLLASPMCGLFGAINNINYDKMRPKDIHSKLREAMKHIKFTLELCMKQCNSGRLFMFEHPATASSWSTTMM